MQISTQICTHICVNEFIWMYIYTNTLTSIHMYVDD